MIKVVIDSGSDVTLQEAETLNVTLLPMEIKIGEEEFLDGVNITKNQFFEKLIECSDFPKTSQINSFRFEECFKELIKDEDDKILVITISSKLSGTYNSALQAAKNYKGKVFVIDSLNACVGERLLLEYALRLIAEGKQIEEIEKILNEQKKKIKVLALLDTLKYLKKGGRISTVVAVTGELFSIKPVVSVIDGEVKLAGKAVGSKKGNNLLCQLVDKCGGIDFDMPYAVVYSGLEDSKLQKYLEDSQFLWISKTENIPKYQIGSTIGTHIGPGAIGVSFFSNN